MLYYQIPEDWAKSGLSSKAWAWPTLKKIGSIYIYQRYRQKNPKVFFFFWILVFRRWRQQQQQQKHQQQQQQQQQQIFIKTFKPDTSECVM